MSIIFPLAPHTPPLSSPLLSGRSSRCSMSSRPRWATCCASAAAAWSLRWSRPAAAPARARRRYVPRSRRRSQGRRQHRRCSRQGQGAGQVSLQQAVLGRVNHTVRMHLARTSCFEDPRLTCHVLGPFRRVIFMEWWYSGIFWDEWIAKMYRSHELY